MATTKLGIRKSVMRMLVENYGYSPRQIDFEVQIDKRFKADCVVYTDERKDEPLVIIEIKKPLLYSLHIEQLATYMRLSQVQYGILTDGLNASCYQLVNNEVIEIVAIPKKGEKETKRLSKLELRPITDFAYRLQKIYGRALSCERFSPSYALGEIRKLMLCKLEDERSHYDNPLFWIDSDEIKKIESPSMQMTIAKRIGFLFSKVKIRYPQLYPESATIDLEPGVLAYSIAQLQNYSLSRASHEDISVAYTQFVSKNMYMKLGQYFTPKQLVEFIVRLLNPVEHERVLDPACGSGGFLLSAMHYVLKEGSGHFSTEAEYARERIFGIDIDQDMVSICKTNMVLHGDGHTNIFLADFLADLPRVYSISLEPFDVIMTDPPFGYTINDRTILQKFKLGENQKSQQINVIFIEKCVEMLRPSGRIAVVVPELFLTSPSLRFARRFVLDNTEVRAIISMPGQTFAPYSSLKTSILILHKKVGAGISENYDVLMIDASEVTMKTLDEIVKFYRNPLEDVEVSGAKIFRLEHSKLGMRWDIAFHRSSELALPKESRRLEQIARFEKGISVPSREHLVRLAEKAVPYIRISDISEGQIRIETTKRVHSRYGKIRVRTGDILFSIRGSIGKTAIVTQPSEGAIPSSQLIVIHPDENLVCRKYLYYILSSHIVQRQLDLLKVGTLISSIPFPEVRGLLIPVPSLKDQEILVCRIDEIERKYAKTSEKQEKVRQELERFFEGGVK